MFFSLLFSVARRDRASTHTHLRQMRQFQRARNVDVTLGALCAKLGRLAAVQPLGSVVQIHASVGERAITGVGEESRCS